MRTAHLRSASVGKYFDLFMHEIYYKAWLLDGGKVRRAVARVVGHPRRCGHRQEDSMNQYAMRRWCSSVCWGDVRARVREWVGESAAAGAGARDGGALGSAKELGSSIVEMQHVDGLQKNLATLKVEAALGGGNRRRPRGDDQWLVAWGTRAVQPCTCPEAGRRRVACWPSSVSWGMAAGRACDETVARRSGGDLCAGLWGLWQCVLAGTRWGFSGCCSPADARCWPWPRPSANLGLP